MAATMKATTMVLIATVMIMAVAPPSAAEMGCGTVVSYLNPCLPYVTDTGPIGNCCSGIKGLYGAAQTTPDRQSVCNCLKQLAASYSGLDYGKAAGLPAQCQVTVPYDISPSTDCSKVQ